MILVICSIIFALGVLGLVLGVRGRRIDQHPVCRKCGYDLSGSTVLPSNCSECGRDLSTGKRTVRVGNRKKNKGVVLCGAVAAVLSLVVGGLWTYQESRGFDLNTIKPAWWLRAEITSSNHERANAARVELLARLNRGELTTAQEAGLVDPVVTLQNDPDGAWHEEWGAFFENSWQRGIVTDEQLSQYLTTAVKLGLHLEARERMRQGSRVAVAALFSSRTARDSLFSMAYAIHDASFAEVNLTEEFSSSRGEWHIHRFRPGGSGGRYFYFDVDAPIGTHTLTIRTRVVAAEGKFSASTVGEQPFDRPLLESELTLSAPIEVVPAETQVMNVVNGDELREAIRSAITIGRPELKADGEGKAGVLGELKCVDSPVEFNAAVLWRIDGEEYWVGLLNAGLDTHRRYASSSWSGWTKVLVDGPPERVDIIVRSTIEDAESAPRLMNDTRVWVGEIVFEDVDVRYLEADENVYTTIETDEAVSEFMQSVDMSALEFRQVGDTVSIRSQGGFSNVPYNFAYECRLRLGEREWYGSSTAIRVGESREFYFGEQKVDQFPDGLRMIDVVLSPNAGMGARSFSEEDIVFNREFVIKDVPVLWIRD